LLGVISIEENCSTGTTRDVAVATAAVVVPVDSLDFVVATVASMCKTLSSVEERTGVRLGLLRIDDATCVCFWIAVEAVDVDVDADVTALYLFKAFATRFSK
jgi:hypothetical protein